jgi:antitoxin YefM
MKTTDFSSFSTNMKSVLDQVILSDMPISITQSDGNDFVVMSKKYFNSMEETFYLLKSSKNAKRLLGSIAQLERGK